MAKEYAAGFYTSAAWRKCRAIVVAECGGLCQRCLRRGLHVPGVVVHHITPITPSNISNAEVTLNIDNLTLLCHECHRTVHGRNNDVGAFDSDGQPIAPANDRWPYSPHSGGRED